MKTKAEIVEILRKYEIEFNHLVLIPITDYENIADEILQPIEQESKVKSAEEILDKYLDATDLEIINKPLLIKAMEEYASQSQQISLSSDWEQIKKDFIEWDNESHSNASQKQILNWFENRLSQSVK